MSIDLEQFHQVFFEESVENIDVIEQTLIDMNVDLETDSEVINTIFRAAHSIKGGSGTFGFTEVTEFTHLMETLLDEVRDGVRPLTKELVDALLKSCDCLRDWLDCLQTKAVLSDELSKPLVIIFETMLNKDGTGDAMENESNTDDDSVNNEAENGMHHWVIEFVPQSSILLSGNEPIRLFRQLEQMGEYTAIANIEKVDDIQLLVVDECFISWRIELKTEVPKADIVEIFEWVIDECTLNINDALDSSEPSTGTSDTNSAKNEELVNETPSVTTTDSQVPVIKEPAETASGPAKTPAASSIRVGIDKVDNLINLVGELVITQSMLSELGNDFDMTKLERLSSGLDQLLQNTKELQENVMRIRMLPISFAFNRFPRMIRDLSEKIGKKVDLQIHGENTELDKTVMEKIGDPLVHLVRNAIDHGIESVADRVAAGKPEMGVIRLDAYHKGGNIVIEIIDDGKGIDADVIQQKAIEKGVISDSTGMTKGEIYDLIFEPGFSTAETVSDISGRGVGMDVVRRNIKALGGRIDIESTVGKGSTFKVQLPLTLAILDGQLVKVGTETFVIPLVSIVESLQVKSELVNRVSGNMILYRLREDNVPIIPLYKEFDIEADNTELDNALLVVVEGDGRKIGLLVDDLLAQQQVVIKSLESNYKRIDGIAGATILGDGSVALILDVPGLVVRATPKLRAAKKVKAA